MKPEQILEYISCLFDSSLEINIIEQYDIGLEHRCCGCSYLYRGKTFPFCRYHNFSVLKSNWVEECFDFIKKEEFVCGHCESLVMDIVRDKDKVDRIHPCCSKNLNSECTDIIKRQKEYHELQNDFFTICEEYTEFGFEDFQSNEPDDDDDLPF